MNINNNSNRGNNNRRRGRGNRQQGGNGQQTNRIDSRARGNAPQLLEKYRKLAHDAHLNGDRVQAEYYLQFADHYFRVLADARTRQEEQRARPQGERWEGGNEESDDSSDFSVESDFPSFDQQPSFNRQQRDDRPHREDRPQRALRQAQDDRDGGDDRPRREERSEQFAQDNDEAERPAQQDQNERDSGDANPYEPPENPFVRADRPRGGLRPRRDNGPRPVRQAQDNRGGDDAGPAGLDPSSLPPAIGAARDDGDGEEAAKPRRGRPRKKPSADDAGGEALESVS